eukprot:scaffold35772_cov44-Tisochrysis_lutea.AAC.2
MEQAQSIRVQRGSEHGYRCRRCGQPKRGHICAANTQGDAPDGVTLRQKAAELSVLSATRIPLSESRVEPSSALGLKVLDPPRERVCLRGEVLHGIPSMLSPLPKPTQNMPLRPGLNANTESTIVESSLSSFFDHATEHNLPVDGIEERTLVAAPDASQQHSSFEHQPIFNCIHEMDEENLDELLQSLQSLTGALVVKDGLSDSLPQVATLDSSHVHVAQGDREYLWSYGPSSAPEQVTAPYGVRDDFRPQPEQATWSQPPLEDAYGQDWYNQQGSLPGQNGNMEHPRTCSSLNKDDPMLAMYCMASLSQSMARRVATA